jgi:hypothetical protein
LVHLHNNIAEASMLRAASLRPRAAARNQLDPSKTWTYHQTPPHQEKLLKNIAGNRGLVRVVSSTPQLRRSIHASGRKLAATGGSPQPARSI